MPLSIPVKRPRDVPSLGAPAGIRLLPRAAGSAPGASLSIFLLLHCVVIPVAAQPYAMDWVIASGGGGYTSSNAAYTLSATIGLTDGSVARTENYQVTGGFWTAFVPGSSELRPGLVLQVVGDQLWISWSPMPAGFGLEQTDDLRTSQWLPVPTHPPITIPLPPHCRFYRLRKH